MRKLKYTFVFILLTGIFCGVWLALNGSTPILQNGDMLPEDLYSNQYRLTGIRWDDNQGGYHLVLSGSTKEDLLLTVSDTDEATVYLWNEPVHSWTENDAYQRVQSIRLPRDVINANGGIDLLFRSRSWGSGTRELLNKRPSRRQS